MTLVREILERKTGNVVTVTREETVLQAATKMNENRIGALAVVDAGRVVGMFTERDVLCRVVALKVDPVSIHIVDVMTTPVITCGPTAKIDDCAAIMSQKKIRHLPVVDDDGDGQLLGMISTGDLMAHQVRDQQIRIEQLHEYLHGRV